MELPDRCLPRIDFRTAYDQDTVDVIEGYHRDIERVAEDAPLNERLEAFQAMDDVEDFIKHAERYVVLEQLDREEELKVLAPTPIYKNKFFAPVVTIILLLLFFK